MDPSPPPPASPLAFLHHLHAFLRHVLAFLRSVLLPSPVALSDLVLSLSFLSSGLLPLTLNLSPSTSLHLWAPPLHRRRRPALLLLHGFGGNSLWQWYRQVSALSPSFDLYVPDLLFFGRSHSAAPDRSVAFQARCVAEAMRRIGVERYDICGISYGGFVAYALAAMAEGVEGRVVILTAGVGATGEEMRGMAEKAGRDVADVLLPQTPRDLVDLMRSSMRRPPRWLPEFFLRDFIQVMYSEHRKERVELLRELLKNGVGMDPLPILSQETLLIWGDCDEVFPIHLGHRLKRHLGEKCGLEIVQDVGHACQLENPHQVNQLIKSFLLDTRLKKEI